MLLDPIIIVTHGANRREGERVRILQPNRTYGPNISSQTSRLLCRLVNFIVVFFETPINIEANRSAIVIMDCC